MLLCNVLILCCFRSFYWFLLSFYFSLIKFFLVSLKSAKISSLKSCFLSLSKALMVVVESECVYFIYGLKTDRFLRILFCVCCCCYFCCFFTMHMGKFFSFHSHSLMETWKVFYVQLCEMKIEEILPHKQGEDEFLKFYLGTALNHFQNWKE